MSTSPGFMASHPAVRAYAVRHGIDPSSFRADGRVTLSFDRRYRVQLRPGPDGRILATARLLYLSDLSPATADEILMQLAKAAAALMREHGPGLCIDHNERALLVQQMLSGSLDAAELEESLAGFVNVLAFWVRVSAREAGADAAPGGRAH